MPASPIPDETWSEPEQQPEPTLYDEHAEGAIAEKSAQHYQYKGSYILTSVKSGLMIIDQQRAHIRILYDQYMNQIANRRNVSQRMLFPDMVHFSPAEIPVLEEIMDDLTALGFELSNLGGGSYAINGIPAGIEGLNPETLVTNMVQTAIEKGCKVKEEVQSMLALSLAKAAAIVPGQVLTNEEMNNLVEIVNLTKKYGANVAVNNLTVSLPKGKIIGLLGPNGSGKTTLIKILNGLLTPTEGTIMIDGNYVGPATKSKVAYLPDRTYLTMNQTIREILDFFQDFYADFSRERAEEMLKSLGIDPSVKMRTLSKGTKEKVQLILVMSRNASLYILDEPIAGVDPAARDYILRTIINNYNPEATVLISTHLIEDVEQVLDEVIFMRYGQLVLYTSVDNIREEKGKSVDAYFREVFAC